MATALIDHAFGFYAGLLEDNAGGKDKRREAAKKMENELKQMLQGFQKRKIDPAGSKGKQ